MTASEATAACDGDAASAGEERQSESDGEGESDREEHPSDSESDSEGAAGATPLQEPGPAQRDGTLREAPMEPAVRLCHKKTITSTRTTCIGAPWSTR